MKRQCKGIPKYGLKPHITTADNFYKDKYAKDGLEPRCKDCWRVKHAEFNAISNPKRYGPNADPQYRATYTRCGTKARVKRLQCRPKWVKETPHIWKAYLAIYNERDKRNKKAGYVKYHVDHIIPLNGNSNFVRGLDVPWNLQIILATDNLKKGAKICP